MKLSKLIESLLKIQEQLKSVDPDVELSIYNVDADHDETGEAKIVEAITKITPEGADSKVWIKDS